MADYNNGKYNNIYSEIISRAAEKVGERFYWNTNLLRAFEDEMRRIVPGLRLPQELYRRAKENENKRIA